MLAVTGLASQELMEDTEATGTTVWRSWARVSCGVEAGMEEDEDGAAEIGAHSHSLGTLEVEVEEVDTAVVTRAFNRRL